MTTAVPENENTPHTSMLLALQTRAQAQASWMLIDSLLMVLVERRLVPAEQLIEAIDVVIATKRGYLQAGSEDAATVQAAIGMLTEVSNSLRATPTAFDR